MNEAVREDEFGLQNDLKSEIPPTKFYTISLESYHNYGQVVYVFSCVAYSKYHAEEQAIEDLRMLIETDDKRLQHMHGGIDKIYEKYFIPTLLGEENDRVTYRIQQIKIDTPFRDIYTYYE
jgi:hypothetical protein